MDSSEPSNGTNDVDSQTFNAYGTGQFVSTGSSRQFINTNTGGGTMYNFANITGDVVINSGKRQMVSILIMLGRALATAME